MDRDDATGAELPGGEAVVPPEHLRERAHVAGNGELLWPRPVAFEAARWMADAGFAIWGGEVYVPRGPFAAVMTNEWRTLPERAPSEDWAGYVGRGLSAALAAIDTYPESAPRAGQPLYFLACQSQAGFPESGRAPRDRRRTRPRGTVEDGDD